MYHVYSCASFLDGRIASEVSAWLSSIESSRRLVKCSFAGHDNWHTLQPVFAVKTRLILVVFLAYVTDSFRSLCIYLAYWRNVKPSMDSPTASVFSLPELRDVFPGCSSYEELYNFSINEVRKPFFSSLSFIVVRSWRFKKSLYIVYW